MKNRRHYKASVWASRERTLPEKPRTSKREDRATRCDEKLAQNRRIALPAALLPMDPML